MFRLAVNRLLKSAICASYLVVLHLQVTMYAIIQFSFLRMSSLYMKTFFACWNLSIDCQPLIVDSSSQLLDLFSVL